MGTYSNVALYIVAHQDDWQLFMTPNANRDMHRSSTKVVFIYTTAGEAGKGRAYWQAREKAALQSIRFALDSPDSPLEELCEGERDVHGHLVHFYRYKSTVSYCLRLPDGRLSGAGSENHHYASLTKLRDGVIASIVAVDYSTVYQNWNDFTQTLSDIVKAETKGCRRVWLNTSDYWLTHAAISNADHIATGLAVVAASAFLDNRCPLILYRDYETGLLPINVSTRQALWQGGLFAAYDVTMERELNHCTRCESEYYMAWPLRQYSRQIYTNSLGSALGVLWIYLLQLIIALHIFSLCVRGKLPNGTTLGRADARRQGDVPQSIMQHEGIEK